MEYSSEQTITQESAGKTMPN